MRRPGRKLTAPRPLAIELRREQLDDVEAKKDGATVEWQSGDPVFDDGWKSRSSARSR